MTETDCLVVWNVTDIDLGEFYDVAYCSTRERAEQIADDMQRDLPWCRYVILPEGVRPISIHSRPSEEGA